EAAGGKLAEGAFTAAALVALARGRGIEMPIAESVAAIVSGAASVEDVVARLLARPLKGEAE
ncbi:glycerol-3-phosphate dehydrogenase, partial [Methylobacterium trifolii]